MTRIKGIVEIPSIQEVMDAHWRPEQKNALSERYAAFEAGVRAMRNAITLVVDHETATEVTST